MTIRKVNLGIEEDIEERSPAHTGTIAGGLSDNRALQVALGTINHGYVYGPITYRDMAHLLSREDLGRILTEMRRDDRHSGVESLDEIGEGRRSLDDYHNAEESGSFSRSNTSRRKETVEVRVQDLIQLRDAARGAPSGKRLSNALTRTARLLNE